MKNATRILISTFGVLVGLSGLEHGIGEVLQGSVAPGSIMFPSWPDSAFFHSLGGEPALSVIPNLLVTGILALLFSMTYLACAVWLARRKHIGLVLMLISIAMLLAGGGVFPPILGIIIGAAATRINTPLTWWRSHLSPGFRHGLDRLWPWSFGACIIAWLAMIPGVSALSYFLGVYDTRLILILLILMFGLLFLTFISGFARDAKRPAGTVAG